MVEADEFVSVGLFEDGQLVRGDVGDLAESGFEAGCGSVSQGGALVVLEDQREDAVGGGCLGEQGFQVGAFLRGGFEFVAAEQGVGVPAASLRQGARLVEARTGGSEDGFARQTAGGARAGGGIGSSEEGGAPLQGVGFGVEGGLGEEGGTGRAA
ncbi:hypothetical protein [Acrocarpospora phusangensis]|uniref:hypothetical protein n=1 Tax=Acrocarpospora phusangensis TaxID=1070424 RepID=UPI001EF3658A|nr:hypothetical protein [Acrocarpospora phusangensis]